MGDYLKEAYRHSPWYARLVAERREQEQNKEGSK